MKRHEMTRPVRRKRIACAPRYWKSVCEQLETRNLLAAHAGCSPEATDPAEIAAIDPAPSAAGVIRAAEAGSTFGTALDWGQLGALKTQAGAVGGSDPSDIVRFSLAGQSRVNIALGGLQRDIDLTLYNSAGTRLAFSNRAGSASESISMMLAPGVYYIAIIPWRGASSSYILAASASAVQPTPPSRAPVTPPPSNPTSPVTALPDVAYYGGTSDWSANAINAPEAWARGYAGAGVVVAVVDTGVDLDHPDLVSQIWVNADEVAGNGVDDDHNGYVDDISGWDFASGDRNPDDGNGHGTHVAGTIAADNNGFGATGVAPDAKIMPVRVLGNDGSGLMTSVAAGIRYAAQNGADIINLSLGGGLSSVIQSAIQYAQQLNVLVVMAAGNEGASVPTYPARFSASNSAALSVGAYASNNAIASFSNDVGNSGAVQVDAPGVSVYSTYMGGGYARLSGTSMATPNVAGLAALALSANPNLTAAQLRTLIVSGANRVIAGSDARGGVNAALTVAMAAAGQVSASASTSATPQRLPTSFIATVRHLASSWTSVSSPTQGTDTSYASMTRSSSDATVRPPQQSLADASLLAKARDQALLALTWADAWDIEVAARHKVVQTASLLDRVEAVSL